ncbi:filamentous hemagglutinin N-terminal domain-containing protein [Nostoc sp. ChiVER01]|uniref:two-partner secretion domain-containing protein n=1 Tax=Nostoc sp. ChiVER01 TaxID=3075382 RepID=UPI002AD32937|nr:filamentous hemagglutinin N-terminal domain-containing protein [Nostoc sp. ChiVER01]MDZ8228168.1 filamentous hemagglutinin N-terminal domain-containing protein [Nostoc sp. ChiVER01]
MATCKDRNWHSNLLGVFSITGVLAHVIFGCENQTLAQITPDGTLGNNSSKITPNVNIKGNTADRIDGGTIRGANLFHSFQEFNVGESQRVYFANPTGISNILTRVTGSNISNIFGTLGVDGGANLFFINPNGILFGNNARLDVAGSFVGSTANSFVFGNGLEFSATNPQIPSSLLTVNPSALLFNQLQAGRIENNSIAPTGDNIFGLRVPDARSLLLVGGEIAINEGKLNAPGGRVELVGIAGEGTVGLNVDGNNLSLIVPDNVYKADISLSNQALVSTSGEGGGAIQVWGKGVTVSGGSKIEASTFGALPGKGLSVNASESVQVVGESPTGIRSGLFAETFGTGDAGNLTINTRQLQILAGGKISSGTNNAGAAGDLSVNASESVRVAGLTVSGQFGSDLFTQSSSGATGKGGKLTIQTSKLLVEDGGQVSVSTSGEGIAGNLTVNASESVQVIGIPDNPYLGSTGIFAASNGAGDAGDITINTRQLLIQNGAGITTDNDGKGVGGGITVNASSVQLVGTAILPQFPDEWYPSNISSDAYGTGPAGKITINTNQLLIQDGGVISALTYGSGAGGNVNINASQSVQMIGTATNSNSVFPFSSSLLTQTWGTGKAGDLAINTNQLIVQEGQLSASTLGLADAGNVIINANDSVFFDNGVVFSDVGDASAQGKDTFAKGGSIDITTDSLFMTNGGQLAARTFGAGKAGNINISSDRLLAENKSAIAANTYGTGDAGNITIASGMMNVLNGSAIAANTLGTGNAGNITIETDTMTVLDSQVGSSVFGKGFAGNLTIRAANSVEVSGKIKSSSNIENPAGLFAQVNTEGEGRGGNLTIETKRLSVSHGGKVQVATFGQGDAGNLTIHASEVEVFDTPVDNLFATGINAGVEIDADETKIPPRGNGGDLTIESDRLSVRGGAVVSVGTAGVGNAGKLQIHASKSVEVVGKSPNGNFNSQISAAVTPEGTGSGGSLKIETEQMSVRDGGEVTVSSTGSGTAGNLDIRASSLRLDNQGAIAAITRSGNGGNITLKLQDLLLLRNGSQISTTAGSSEFGGDGGNITINSPFIVAVSNENSDISANAFTGIGGRVDITTNGIYGILPQKSPTENSDITASSELGVSGEVTINSPDTDPSRGLIQLPSNLIDASQQIAQGCTPRRGQNASSFIATGRGGLPQSPNEPLQGRAVITGWVDLPAQTTAITDKSSTATMTKSSDEIVEAQGWIVDGNGDIMLVAQSGQSSSIPSTMSCSQ